MSIKKYDVLVIGDANVDLILRGEDIVPDFGQAEKLVEDASMELGGSAAIFACGASRLGLKVGFIGKLGEDTFGKFLKNVMDERGIDTSPIWMASSRRTGLTVHFSRPHDRAMLTFPGTINELSCDDIDTQLFDQTRHVHLGSYYLQTALQPVLAGFFNGLKSKGVSISLDPGWDPLEKWNGNLGKVLDQIDVFLPNDQEAMRITSSETTSQALRELTRYSLVPVIKLGDKGACSIWKDELISQPVYKVRNIDTTGAGDSFNADSICYLQEKDIGDCLVGCVQCLRQCIREGWAACRLMSKVSSMKLHINRPDFSEVKRFQQELNEILN
jgi:sugar/nucleoside kinase (ribokinase family)